MALVFPGWTECPLCGKVIEEGDEFVSTFAFVSDPEDDFWPHSDAAMHRPCFLGWARKNEFIRRFNRAMRELGFQKRLFPDGTILDMDPRT
jgi:hypothetical protein